MWRKFWSFQRLSKIPPKLYSARFDPISLERSELIRELCKSHKDEHPDVNNNSEPIHNSWSSKFVAIAHLLENYMLFQHYEAEKIILQRFRSVNPDISNNISEDDLSFKKENKSKQNFKEKSFLTQFAYILKQAGYVEVPEITVEKRLKFDYEEKYIKVKVPRKQYAFLRFWVNGRKESPDEPTKVLHERVIVASRTGESNVMILKGFKDIDVKQFESLLPEAKVQIPRHRRWVMNIFLTGTATIAFFDFAMMMLTDYKLDSVTILFAFCGFLAYRTSAMYKLETKKYILAWKSMLYYKSTANNSGLVLDSINRAHERSLKEVLIVYGTALRLSHTGQLVTEKQIIEAACEWLSTTNQLPVEDKDVNFAASFCLLERLNLMILHSHNSTLGQLQYRVLRLEEAAIGLLQVVQHIASC